MKPNIFQYIASPRVKRNKFDLSHERKMSMNMGDLVPVLVQDVVPGDKFKVNTEVFMRFAPMLAPVMHRINVYTHYFFVPNRLVWNEWEDFITGGRQGDLEPVHPFIVYDDTKSGNGAINKQFQKGSLYDYLGLPVVPQDYISEPAKFSVLPFRAYQLIFNEYCQDQNLSSPIDFSMGSGEVTTDIEINKIMQLRKRAWEKDYFTSALPWAQRGGEVNIHGVPTYLDESEFYTADGGAMVGGTPTLSAAAGGADEGRLLDAASEALRVENLDGMNITVNNLRKAIKLQEWLEKTARGGSRYIEQILSHFGVKSSDARLQRPEYLGGGKAPVSISEVLSTYEADSGEIPQGNMSGHGISVGRSNTFTKSFEEHGHVIGIMSVLPRTAYQQGINRMWKRFDKFDHYWPEFAHLGEQEIKNEEIYWDSHGASGSSQNTFGYQSRYAEYKYKESSVHGDFRDNLAYWHEGRIFSSAPALNESFITSDPSHRIFNVNDPSTDKLYVQLYNKISALRPMPYFGTPKL